MKQALYLFLLMAAAGGVYATVSLRRIIREGRPRALEKADAILVFGAAVFPDGPSLSLQLRALRAARLYADGWAPRVICTGGWSRGQSEAGVMRTLLVEQGVPAGAVIPDDGGVSTREGIRSARRFGQGHWQRVIAVSSPYHLYRIGREARRQGLETIPCPALRPGPRTFRLLVFDMRQYLREVAAAPAYGVSWHLHRFLHGRLGGKAVGAVRQVSGRLKSLFGEADAVAAASDTISLRIKSAVTEFSDTDTVMTPASGLGKPVEGTIGHRFGLRHNRLHSGVDFRAAYGSRVAASAAGKVVFTGRLGPYGNVMVIHHGGGLATVYGHLAGFVVTDDEKITDGQLIGYLGETGRSYGPHLHFEVRVHGSPVEPLIYLPEGSNFLFPRDMAP